MVTTVDADGSAHVAPMGVRYRGRRWLVLKPFRPSTTLDKSCATRPAVLNFVDRRARLRRLRHRRGATGRPCRPSAIAGVRLACALRHVELSWPSSATTRSARLRMARVHEATHAPFLGFNRAQAAVIEGAVLVSRLHMLPADKVDAEMAYLQIAIDKTAGAEEREAWGWLQEAVGRAARRAGRLVEREMQLLVSVRSVEEALAVAAAGADLIDLKEPRDGALGGLRSGDLARHRRRAAARGLPSARSARPSATCRCDERGVAAGARRRGRGLRRRSTSRWASSRGTAQAPRVIDALAASGAAVVPVFLADHGIDFALVQAACALGFPALMVDTGDKRAGSLFDVADEAGLRRFIAMARGARRMAGLAGSLQTAHIERLRRLAPDYAGFRSAVCAGDRSGTLEASRVRGLAAQLRAGAEAPA